MAEIKWRGLFKGLFFVSPIGAIVYPFSYHLQLIANLSRLSKFIRKQKKTLEYNDFYTPKFDYHKRLELFKYVIDKEGLDDEIDYLEFGVEKGGSFKWWLDNIKNSNANFYGFDTFTGLPEAWGPYKKGEMSNMNKIPEIQDSRAKLIQGLFQQTLPGFLKEYDPTKRKVIHMDADIYSATLYVLTSMAQYFQKGDIIFFDEFNVPMHEFKAFMEFVNSYYVEYEVLGAINNFYQVAVKIK